MSKPINKINKQNLDIMKRRKMITKDKTNKFGNMFETEIFMKGILDGKYVNDSVVIIVYSRNALAKQIRSIRQAWNR